jgi:hypothetical protein
MIAAKVLSPQFVVWIAPLFVLVVEGPIGALLAILTAVLTTEIYPYLYPALMDQAPGHARAVLELAARNALLVGWYVVAIRRLAGEPARAWRPAAEGRALHGPILPLRRG